MEIGNENNGSSTLLAVELYFITIFLFITRQSLKLGNLLARPKSNAQ